MEMLIVFVKFSAESTNNVQIHRWWGCDDVGQAPALCRHNRVKRQWSVANTRRLHLLLSVLHDLLLRFRCSSSWRRWRGESPWWRRWCAGERDLHNKSSPLWQRQTWFMSKTNIFTVSNSSFHFQLLLNYKLCCVYICRKNKQPRSSSVFSVPAVVMVTASVMVTTMVLMMVAITWRIRRRRMMTSKPTSWSKLLSNYS